MPVSRRSVLHAAIGSAGVIVAESALAAPAGASAGATDARRRLVGPDPAYTGTFTPNGWPVNRQAGIGGSVWPRPVVGTGASVEVSMGEVEEVLVHVLRRFHYEIATLGPGDIVGFRTAAGLRGQQRNHASGTAVDVLPGHYPAGSAGNFYPAQLAVIRDVLKQCQGVVRWGGDFKTPDEAHFQIGVSPGNPALSRLAATLRRWRETAGQGAGATGLTA